jgi:hypothetical protein
MVTIIIHHANYPRRRHAIWDSNLQKMTLWDADSSHLGRTRADYEPVLALDYLSAFSRGRRRCPVHLEGESLSRSEYLDFLLANLMSAIISYNPWQNITPQIESAQCEQNTE